jgi:hypothetical protein
MTDYDTAGWGVLYTLSAVAFLGLLWTMYNKWDVITDYVGAKAPGIRYYFSFFNSVGLFIPDMAIIGGILVDLMSQQFKYSLSSVTALLSILITYIISRWTGNFGGLPIASTSLLSSLGRATNVVTEEVKSIPITLGFVGAGRQSGEGMESPCTIPWLQYFENGAPMRLTALTSIAIIYMLDAFLQDVPNKSAIAGTVGGTFVLHLISMRTNYCGYSWFGMFISMLIGGLVGIAVYFATYGLNPSLLPFATPSSSSAPPPPDTQCNASDDPDKGTETVTCQLYQNGKRITSSIVPE